MPTRRSPTSRAASAPRTTRSSRGMHEASALVAGPASRAARAVWTGEAEHAVNVAGGLHHAMPGAGERLLRLQRPGDRDRLAARAGRRARRLRRRRRAPRRRRRGDLLGRPAGADHLAARERPLRCSPAPASPTTSAAPAPRAPPSTSRCRPARATPAGCAPSTRWSAAARGVPPAGPGHPARLRQPRAGPAGPPGLTVDGAARRPTPRCTGWRTSYAGGRWVATGGGGYELVEVVPRAWTHLIAEAAGPPSTPRRRHPQDWRAHVRAARRAARAAADDRRRDAGVARPGRTATTRRTRSTGPCWRPSRRCSRPTGSAGCWTSLEQHRCSTRDELREHLSDARIAGDVATPREDNLDQVRHARRSPLQGDVRARADRAVDPRRRPRPDGEKVGVSPDPATCAGQDRIDPDLTIDGLDRMADHLGRAGRDRSRVLARHRSSRGPARRAPGSGRRRCARPEPRSSTPGPGSSTSR